MDGYRYNLGDRVSLKETNESGEVIGRAEYAYAEPSYLVRHKAGDGRQISDWLTESAIA